MKIKIIIMLMFSIFAFHSCASTVKIIKVVPVVSPGQNITTDEGKEIISAQKRHLVSLSPYSLPDIAKDKTMFQVRVQNLGNELIRITYDNIWIIFEEKAKEASSTTINVQSFDDFMKNFDEEAKKNESEWIQNALSQIKDQRQSEIDDIAYNYDPTDLSDQTKALKLSNIDEVERKVKADQAAMENELASRRRNDQKLRNEMIGLVMKPMTIMPGEESLCIFIGDSRNLSKDAVGRLQVIISVDGEEYKFDFDRSIEIKDR